MPWEKKFENVAVLEKAMHAFWARGYEATSIRDLVACMGINRGSIYATFHDKRNLFLLALEHYDTRYRRALLADLRRQASPREAITRLFDDVVEQALRESGGAGCMLINAAVEMAPHDKGVAAAVARGLEETELFFEQLISSGQRKGEFSPAIDAGETAAVLLGLLTALRVLARGGAQRAKLESLASQAKALLR